jgi:hypothetical protein
MPPAKSEAQPTQYKPFDLPEELNSGVGQAPKAEAIEASAQPVGLGLLKQTPSQ